MRAAWWGFDLVLAGIAAGTACSCTPTVQIAAPREPITINLNVKIEHEIRVKVDEELDATFDREKDIF